LALHIAILGTKWMRLASGHGDFYHLAEELLEVRGWVSAGVDVLKKIDLLPSPGVELRSSSSTCSSHRTDYAVSALTQFIVIANI
jgi:hypothetical protein